MYAVITLRTFIIEFYIISIIKKQHREYTLTKSPYLLLLEIVHDFELSPKEQRAHHVWTKMSQKESIKHRLPFPLSFRTFAAVSFTGMVGPTNWLTDSEIWWGLDRKIAAFLKKNPGEQLKIVCKPHDSWAVYKLGGCFFYQPNGDHRSQSDWIISTRSSSIGEFHYLSQTKTPKSPIA